MEVFTIRYYKVVQDHKILGVVTSDDFTYFQRKHGTLLFCDADMAQFVRVGDTLYHDVWMRSINNVNFDYVTTDIVEIEESEYSALFEALETEQQIIEEEKIDIVVVDDEKIDTDLQYAKSMKIAAMSKACENAITEGFDIAGVHYGCSLDDQINYLALGSVLNDGAEVVPFEDRIIAASEMKEIINAAMSHKLYHLSYFNSMKNWIEKVRSFNTLNKIDYGVDIPEKYKSEVLKSLE